MTMSPPAGPGPNRYVSGYDKEGNPIYSKPPSYSPPPGKNQSVHDGLAITCFILAFFAPLLGLILGFVSVSTAHRDNRRGSGLAVAAIIIGALGTIGIIIIVIAITAASSRTGMVPAPCDYTNPAYPYC